MKPVKKDPYLQELKKVIVFRYLDEALLKEVLDIAEVLSCEPEEQIVAEGDTSPHFFAVLEGAVNVTVSEEDRADVFISAIGKGDIFGEAAIFIEMKRTASIVAAERSVLLRIERRKLLTFIKARPSAGIKILMIVIYSLLKKLRDANQELAFERKSDIDQDDIDSVVDEIMMR